MTLHGGQVSAGGLVLPPTWNLIPSPALAWKKSQGCPAPGAMLFADSDSQWIFGQSTNIPVKTEHNDTLPLLFLSLSGEDDKQKTAIRESSSVPYVVTNSPGLPKQSPDPRTLLAGALPPQLLLLSVTASVSPVGSTDLWHPLYFGVSLLGACEEKHGNAQKMSKACSAKFHILGEATFSKKKMWVSDKLQIIF